MNGLIEPDNKILPAFSAMLEQGRLTYASLLKAASGTLIGPLAPRLPGPPLLAFDEVWGVSSNGGTHGAGAAYATVSLHRLSWAFECHFDNDPILPATFAVEALLQLAGLWGAACGLQGRGRVARVGEVKLVAEITPRQHRLTYAISVRQFSRRRRIVIADGTASISGKPCIKASDMMVVVLPHATVERAGAAASAVLNRSAPGSRANPSQSDC